MLSNNAETKRYHKLLLLLQKKYKVTSLCKKYKCYSRKRKLKLEFILYHKQTAI